MKTVYLLTAGVLAGMLISQDNRQRAQEPLKPLTPTITQSEVERSVRELPEPKWNVSAYCPCEKCCGKYSKGQHYRQTANGYKILPGDVLIAAPPEIPFGTWITVPGYGRAQVKDRGGAIKGRKLDLYFSTHKAALQWGRQYLAINIEK